MSSSFKRIGAWAGVIMLTAGAASAQEKLGSDGQFALSVDRVFGVVFASESTKQGDTAQTVSVTSVSLLTNPLHSLTTSYSFPRVAADYLTAGGVTLGAALGFSTVSGSAEVEQGSLSAEEDTGSGSGFLLVPRVGYVLMFQDEIGIWPRGGVSYVTVSAESDDGTVDTSANRLALTLEVPLVISPVPHAGFSIGPTLDLGLSGSNEATTTNPLTNTQTTGERDVTGTELGLQAGVFLYF
jgi:hypothetical protein